MIQQDGVDRKDFSTDLPDLIDKLGFLSNVMKDHDPDTEPWALATQADCRAIGLFLSEIAGDLREINDALYGKDKKEARHE